MCVHLVFYLCDLVDLSRFRINRDSLFAHRIHASTYMHTKSKTNPYSWRIQEMDVRCKYARARSLPIVQQISARLFNDCDGLDHSFFESSETESAGISLATLYRSSNVFAVENTKLWTCDGRSAWPRCRRFWWKQSEDQYRFRFAKRLIIRPWPVQDFRIANRPGESLSARRALSESMAEVPDKDCKNSPNRSHSPLVMKLLMSPPLSSCSCRSNCRQFMTLD